MDRNERVRDLFAQALGLSAEERAAFLDEQCGDDAELRREVERLLDHDRTEGAAGAPFAQSAESLARALAALRPGEIIDGRFRIKRLLGEGGMGAVYEAAQLVPIERDVALKIIKPGMDSRRVLARFEAERQALAIMDHAGIARVLDAGIAEDQRPYFVMELVDGVPIDRYCGARRLSMRERLDLFVDVCHAVQHAHQKGVIHRDIKPSNILVMEQAGKAVPKVIDFGIAKATERKLTEQTLVTEMGLLIGTPEYMSPEQAGSGDIDTRSDIYALGVVLYQLLTGTTPFESRELRRLGFEEILRVIREVEPPRPSTRVAEMPPTAAPGTSQTDTTTLRRQLRGDLDWIIMRALEKDRRRRYESADALAADICRHLAHEPVTAGPPSAAYHIAKFARRHVIGLAAVACVFVTLVFATIVSIRFAVDANEARAAEADRAKEAQQSEYQARLAAADAALLDLDIVAARDHLDEVDEPFRASFEYRHMMGGIDQSIRVLGPPDEGPDASARLGRAPASWQVHALDVAPDGRVASGAQDGVVRIWDPESGTVVLTLDHGPDVEHRSVLNVVFDATGERVFTAADEAGINVWYLEDPPRRVHLGDHAGGSAAVALDASGTRIATAGADGVVLVRDAQTGETLHTLTGHAAEGGAVIWHVEFSPDGARVASASDDHTARIWSLDDAAAPPLVIDQHDDLVMWISFNGRGDLVATTSRDRTVRLWDARTGEHRRTFAGHTSKVSSAVFSPDDSKVLSASNDGTLRIWDVASGTPLATLTGHTMFTFPARYTHDGRHIFSASYDGTVRMWKAAAGDRPRHLPGHALSVDDVEFSPDGELLVTSDMGGALMLWDPDTSVQLARWELDGGVHDIAFAPDGTWFAAGGQDVLTHVYDARTGASVAELSEPGGTIFSLAAHPDGRRLASGARDGKIRIWSIPDGTLVRTIQAHAAEVASLAFAPDGRLASGGRDRAVSLWDVETGVQLATSTDHTWFVSWVGFTPDGSKLISSGFDGRIHIRDPRTAVPMIEPLVDPHPIFQLAISPDGSRLAVARNLGDPPLWDLNELEPLARLHGLPSAVASIAFDPDGDLVVAGSAQSVVMWDAAPSADRIVAGERRAAVAERVEPLVLQALGEHAEALDAHRALAAHAELDDESREIALQLLLVHAVERSRASQGVQ